MTQKEQAIIIVLCFSLVGMAAAIGIVLVKRGMAEADEPLATGPEEPGSAAPPPEGDGVEEAAPSGRGEEELEGAEAGADDGQTTDPGPGTEEVETPGPGGEEVETPQPGTEDVETPEPGTEDVETPEPGTEDVETPEPGTEDVETPEPGTEDVETPEPGTEDVETPEPGTEDVETPEPGTEDVQTPEPGTGEVDTPEPATPGAGTGDVESPEVETPEPARAVGGFVWTSGRVQDASGQPVAGAEVFSASRARTYSVAEEWAAASSESTAVSGADGSFRIRLPAGEPAELGACKFGAGIGSAAVPAPGASGVTIILPAPVRAEIQLDTSGYKRLRSVHVRSLCGRAHLETRAVAGASGVFLADGLAPGPVEVAVRVRDGTFTCRTELQGDAIRVVLPPSEGELNGQLALPEGSGRVELELFVRHGDFLVQYRSRRSLGSISYLTMLSGDAVFVLDDSQRIPVTIQVGSALMVSVPTGSIHGSVAGSPRGVVTAACADSTAIEADPAIPGTPRGEVDPAGAFRVEHLAAGTYDLILESPVGNQVIAAGVMVGDGADIDVGALTLPR